MKQDLKYVATTCLGGLNESVDAAAPEQCQVALNVWSPAGRVEQRPGYRATASILPVPTSATTPYGTVVVESPLGTFTTTDVLDNLPVGDRWYVMISALPALPAVGVGAYPDPPNSNESWAWVEYWNGEQWLSLSGAEFNGAGSGLISYVHLEGAPTLFTMPIPEDIAETTINGVVGYAVRFTVQSFNGSTALDSDVVATDVGFIEAPTGRFKFAALNFIAGSRFAAFQLDSYVERTALWDTIRGPTGGPYDGPINPFQQSDQTSTAVVPQFDDSYVQLGNIGYRFQFDQDPALATVEDDPAIIGPGTQYDATVVQQLTAWPNAKFTTYFQGQLWAANFPDDNGAVMWSAPQPFYRVWPILNQETLAEDDNSPITGLRGFGQTMTVYKNDSIWALVDAGTAALGLATYATQKMVHGVGAVSNGSIAEVLGRHVFLAEDGIYAYDGTPNPRKLTLDRRTGADRLINTIASINPVAREGATAVNWRTKNVYLLAVPTNGAQYNNLVIVWDYKNDAFWLWDNVEVESWILNEDGADNEHLYFVDRYGRIFEFGVGKVDHGAAITSTVTTADLTMDAFGPRKTVRDLRVYSTNSSQTVTASLAYDDDVDNAVTTVLNFTDPTEKNYAEDGSYVVSETAFYNSSNYTAKRRREKRTARRVTGNWFTVTLTHSEKNADFAFNSIALGIQPLGRR